MKSKCCLAPVSTQFSEEGTNYHFCLGCHKACDVIKFHKLTKKSIHEMISRHMDWMDEVEWYTLSIENKLEVLAEQVNKLSKLTTKE